jgi:peptide/nickel transport system substrate-binding protein
MVATSKLNFFRGSWIADYPDAENYLSLFYSKNKSPDGPNYTHFSNSYFDSLYVASLSENISNNRYMLYNKMNQLILDSAVIVPLYYDNVLRFSSKNIAGLEGNAMNLLSLKAVSKNIP